jgi:thiamine kinase-like enzyme
VVWCYVETSSNISFLSYLLRLLSQIHRHLESEEQLKRRIVAVLKDIVPSWRKVPEDANIVVERISGALTNSVFCVAWPPGEDVTTCTPNSFASKVEKKKLPTSSSKFKVLFRVFGEGSDDFVNRYDELYWLSHLSHHRLAPKLLGLFANGRVEEFVEAESLNKISMRDADVSAAIASKLFRLHALGEMVEGSLHKESRSPVLWDTVFLWYKQVMTQLEEIGSQNPSHAELFESFDFEGLGKSILSYKQMLDQLESPLVFCHNDVSSN